MSDTSILCACTHPRALHEGLQRQCMASRQCKCRRFDDLVSWCRAASNEALSTARRETMANLYALEKVAVEAREKRWTLDHAFAANMGEVRTRLRVIEHYLAKRREAVK